MDASRSWKQLGGTFHDCFGLIHQLSVEQDGAHGREQSFTWRRMIHSLKKLPARFLKLRILKVGQGDQRGKAVQHFRRAGPAPMEGKVSPIEWFGIGIFLLQPIRFSQPVQIVFQTVVHRRQLFRIRKACKKFCAASS